MTTNNTTKLKEAQKQLKLAQEAVDKLLLEPAILELEDDDYCLYISGGVVTKKEYLSHFLKAGCARKTRELAELASKNMTTRNRLEAWVHQMQGNGKGYYHIQHSEGYYKLTSSDSFSINLGSVRMEKETAEWITTLLNDGRIIL